MERKRNLTDWLLFATGIVLLITALFIGVGFAVVPKQGTVF